jgi:predicted Zn-dependent protease
VTAGSIVRRSRRRLCLRVSLSLLLAAQASCGGWRQWGGDSAEAQRAAPHFRPGFNLFSPEQDVELGRQSAAQIAREAPLLRDEEVSAYVSSLGAKLAAHAPGEKFPYQFRVVASREVNAFALPFGELVTAEGAAHAVNYNSPSRFARAIGRDLGGASPEGRRPASDSIEHAIAGGVER